MTALEAASLQLSDLEQQLVDSNPQLYRHLALYLQVLRDGLLNRVQQACFHLATQVYPERYGQLPARQRQALHRRIVSLVQRASSLLTVEQVAHLAAQMAREQQRRRRRQQSQLLSALEHHDESDQQADEPGESPVLETMPGSVHLGLSLPIGADFLHPGRFGFQASEPQPSTDREDDQPHQQGSNSDRGAGEDSPADREAFTAEQAMADALSAWMAQNTASDGNETPWDGGQLPGDPGLLLAWLNGFEAALARRLRNLSHALNVELLRQGISHTLLPVSLLDAALTGQLESQEAPANLLRLPLPLGPDQGAARLETMAVLLRSLDLELELPKLRTCRSRLQQHRQEVRRMAQHYRRIQRRVQALEAEQLWLQDINSAMQPRIQLP